MPGKLSFFEKTVAEFSCFRRFPTVYRGGIPTTGKALSSRVRATSIDVNLTRES